MKNKFIILILLVQLFIPQIVKSQKQDLLTDVAPINRTIKDLESLNVEKVNCVEDIYGDQWNTTSSFSYNNVKIPNNFTIDLRHFTIPVPNKNYTKVTSKFGYRPRFGRMHYGVDLKVFTGDTIYSAFDGKVRVKKFDANGYGYYIVIRHKNGLETLYAHLSKQLVNINQEVKSGQPIGLGGNTGRSFGSHLHFETRILGKAIDPEFLFDFTYRDVTQDYYTYNNDNYNNKMIAMLPNEKKRHFYKIKQGDTLEKISKKLGIHISTLCKINNIKSKQILKPGQLLKY
jgi:murein DD-endopeptidase MepM/ murein hydrolase activator NlpD